MSCFTFMRWYINIHQSITGAWIHCQFEFLGQSVTKSPERSDLYRAFVLLFVFHAVHLFTSKENAVSALQVMFIMVFEDSLPQNKWANFYQTWHQASIGEGYRTSPGWGNIKLSGNTFVSLNYWVNFDFSTDLSIFV